MEAQGKHVWDPRMGVEVVVRFIGKDMEGFPSSPCVISVHPAVGRVQPCLHQAQKEG